MQIPFTFKYLKRLHKIGQWFLLKFLLIFLVRSTEGTVGWPSSPSKKPAHAKARPVDWKLIFNVEVVVQNRQKVFVSPTDNGPLSQDIVQSAPAEGKELVGKGEDQQD